MSGLLAGQLLNLAISRSRSQERIEPPVTSFRAYRIVLNTKTAKYRAIPVGRITTVQTHRKISAQKFGEKKVITAESFELLVSSESEAAEWRDQDVVKAALEWARVNEPRGMSINLLSETLLAVLAASHGCPATGARGDFDLLSAGNYLELKPVDSSAAA